MARLGEFDEILWPRGWVDAIFSPEGWFDPTLDIGPIAGTESSTLAGITISAVGNEPVAGTASPTLAGISIASTGTAPVAGTASSTLADATISAAGAVPEVGSLSVTLGGASLSGAGASPEAGSLSMTLDAATVSAAGTAPTAASLATMLDAATVAATGNEPGTGGLSATLGAASVSGVGNEPVAGTVGVALGDAGLSAAGNEPASASLAASMGSVTLSASGVVTGALVTGSASVTLDNATSSSAGTVATPTLWSRTRQAIMSRYERKETDMFSYSINYSATLSGTAGNVAAGDVLYHDANGFWVPASDSHRTGIAKAIALTSGGSVVSVSASGNVPTGITGLGAGDAGLLRVNHTTSKLERVALADPGDELVGWCDAAGTATLAFGGMGSLPIYFGSAAPVSGTWALPSIVYNVAPASGGYVGWVLTVAGTPGTWKEFGLIA